MVILNITLCPTVDYFRHNPSLKHHSDAETRYFPCLLHSIVRECSAAVVKDNPLIPRKAAQETGDTVRGSQCLESTQAVRS